MSIACGSFREDASTSDGGAADAGDAGPGVDASAACPGAAACDRYVFVTRTQFSGALGGPLGADGLCQQAADAAVAPILGKKFKAWISAAGLPATTRLVQGTKPYRLANGTVIAESWEVLLSAPLAHAINVDERGQDVTGTGDVWSNTSNDGKTAKQGEKEDCANWTKSSGFGNVGELSSNIGWSSNGTNVSCGLPTRVYCFEE